MLMALQQVSAGSSLRKADIHQNEKDRELYENKLKEIQEKIEDCMSRRLLCVEVTLGITMESGKQNVTKCVFDEDLETFVAFDDYYIDDDAKIRLIDNGKVHVDDDV